MGQRKSKQETNEQPTVDNSTTGKSSNDFNIVCSLNTVGATQNDVAKPRGNDIGLKSMPLLKCIEDI